MKVPVVAAAPLALLLACGVQADDQATAPPTPRDQLTARFDYDPFFESYPSLAWAHPVRGRDTLSLTLTDYLHWRTQELDLAFNRAWGSWTISPALGATAGPGGWGLSPGRRYYVGRDVVPQLGFYYASPVLEGEIYHAAWLPTQEPRDTSQSYVESEVWAVAKRRGWELGPHLEAFGTQEGRGPWRLSHFWIGAHLLRELPRGSSVQGFLGYDTVSLDSYFGAPKRAGFVFQATVVCPLLGAGPNPSLN